MKQKYMQQIRNLVTPTASNKQMGGNGLREKLFIDLASTGHRVSELTSRKLDHSKVLTAKNYLKKAGA